MPNNPSAEEIAAAFDQFWSIYPRKDDKKDARKAFASAVKTASIREILDGLEAQVQAGMFAAQIANAERQGRPKHHFIKLPAGWLRAERWANEVVQARRPTFRNGALEALTQAWERGDAVMLEGPAGD